jgi:hypothetical protein
MFRHARRPSLGSRRWQTCAPNIKTKESCDPHCDVLYEASGRFVVKEGVLISGEKVLRVGTALVVISVVSCGGGTSNSGGGSGGGGGGGANAPQIALISPSMVMSDVLVGAVDITGSGFTSQSQVLFDGSPVITTFLGDSHAIEGQVKIGLPLGVHQISVQNGSQVSNSLPYTKYYPVAAPTNLFDAFGGYYAGPLNGVTSAPIIGDFDGDGRDDVIVNGPATASGGPTVVLLLVQADGTLSALRSIPNVSASAAGDVDGNGTIDLVGLEIGNSGIDCLVYLNDGHANFTPGPSCPTIRSGAVISWKLVDMNGDGLPDLLVSQQAPNAIYLLLNKGGGNFAPATVIAQPGGNGTFAVEDFNGDGLPDLAFNAANAVTGADEIHLLLNQGGGKFQDVIPAGLQGSAGTIVAADFNLDGKMDLVAEISAVPVVKVRLFLNQGSNTFSQSSETVLQPQNFSTYQFVVGDFDHDGFPDLAGKNADGQPSYLVYLWGNGRGQFADQQVNGPEGLSVATGDINGDGLPDVVVPDSSNQISVALGRNDRNYPSVFELAPAPGPIVSVADVNGDGVADIFVGGSEVPPFAVPIAM